MIIEHRQKKIKILGDTHLGRAFINNVPLHRRGDREKMVKDQFIHELNPDGCDYHIHMGDLFDKPKVSLETIMHAATGYIVASVQYPATNFFILQGNHDKSRDLEATSAFDIFRQIVGVCENVHVVSGALRHDGMLLCGWDPIIPARDIIIADAEIAFGHWDVDLRSDPFNLIPTEALSVRGVSRAFTGHVHLADQFKRDGVDVTVVGSMVGYAHGEGEPYITISLEEARTRDDLRDKCVRIDLQPGEIFDLQIDCLQLQIRTLEEQEAEALDVGLGEFSLMSVFDETMAEFDLPTPIAGELRSRCEQLFTQQA